VPALRADVRVLLWAAPLVIACRSSGPARTPAEFFPMRGGLSLPFSEAVRKGDMLYLSGQLGTDSTGHLVPGGIQAETRQALTNIADVLGRHGSSMEQVVKCTVMLADIKDWPAMNEVYVTFFRGHRPARSAFATNGLALGARLEIECMAQIV
jgi:2-iminobutanoate/2-iminopropanoate deaminase